ncbi:MAG: AarF/ABC1/UbiB kinase family protein [Bdellovibrionales bacterium]|nr:AarF/ABC1/UbiB kinase family protein [Bdellovibrionales bacterium]
MFKSFETTPLAAGSIAQVYRGVWHDGSNVVVKIKRPEIDKKITDDLEILVWLAESMELHLPKARKYHPSIAAKELLRYTNKELDFSNEAQVAQLIGNIFESSDDILVPKIFLHTRNMIVMEYIDSFPLDDIEKIKAHNIDVENLVRSGLFAMLKQIFDVGYFHGDPHPGNLHVTPDGKIVFLDFGIFGQLDEKMRRYGALVLLEVTKGNMALMSHFLLQMADIEEGANIREFVRKVSDAYHTWRMSTIGEYGFGKLVFQMFTLGAQHGVRFPPDLVLYSKAMLTIEGVALALAPGLNLANESAPYFEKLKNQLFSFERLKDQVVDSIPIWFDLMERLPVGLAFGFDHLLSQSSISTVSDKHVKKTQSGFLTSKSIFGIGLLLSGSILISGNEGLGHSVPLLIGYGFISLGFILAVTAQLRPRSTNWEFE